ncbi:MAG: DUF1622 domain-containing protein [Synergistaceae bacterium]|nr:DUF1622 domain-containing protein [Synergistaceae bacterium]
MDITQMMEHGIWWLHQFAEYACAVIEFISILIIIGGVAVAITRGVKVIGRHRIDHSKPARDEWIQVRLSFEDTLMLGLQFLMAADIIGTISNPDVQGVIVLSVIVLLRVILSFTLSREVAEMNRQKREMQKMSGAE